MAEPRELIDRARHEGRTTLDEAEAKLLLAGYGVPVVAEAAVRDAAEAAAAARALGFPVVLKGRGARLTHKTERGLVRLHLKDEKELLAAAAAIAAAAGDDLEGLLVQPMLAGRREFVAGLLRDAQFGPVVMFGLGGVFTEALRDVTFRIAPLDEPEAERMLAELRAAELLGPFRGEAAADRDAIVRALAGLSRLAAELPDVAEVDLNPLLVGADGRVTAVDALVVLGPAAAPPRETGDLSFLDAMLCPRSVALVGAKRASDESWQNLLVMIKTYGYTGRLYPINPRAEEIEGFKAYPGLRALPEPVDLVIVAVPAPRVPAALEDCVATGNRNVHIFAAGFKETGTQEGLRLQVQIEEIAARGGLHVIGPNCMGVFNPRIRLTTWLPAPAPVGSVAFVSQSGGHAGDLAVLADQLGIHFSKAVSYGNALTLDCTDFLAHLAHDAATDIICLYVEGVRDGGKLVRQLAAINWTKPVVIMKGGLTESGARAVASHTGSLAGGVHLWEALFRQTGAVKVTSLEEMVDVVLALRHLGTPRGRGVAVIGTGGGIGVWAADSFARAGLELPLLAAETQAQLRAFIPDAGNITKNPVDAGLAFADLATLERSLRILAGDPRIDMIVAAIPLDWFFDVGQGRHLEELARYLAGPAREHAGGKPLAVAYRRYRTDPGIPEAEASLQRVLVAGGIPVYNGLPRAAFALASAAAYHEFRRRHAG
jgi:acyl-CoA synthetase (NDP forming)